MARGRRLRMVASLASVGAISIATLALANSTRVSGGTASNRRAAIRDAQHLLRGVVPPAGAVVRSSGTAIGARLLTAAAASAVAYRTWTVPSDPVSVLLFVQAHLPPGSTVVSRGSGGPTFMRSVIRSWPPLHGVLASRWLEIVVTSGADGGTRLYAQSQSQWVIARPKGEYLPAGVREVDITDRWPGKPPFLSRRVRSRASVHKLVTLFSSLGIAQPVGINCPAEAIAPVVEIEFRLAAAGPPVARAQVSSSANFSWPAEAAGWACFPIAFTIHGRSWTPLVGNVITPIQRLLHVKLNRSR